MLLRAALLGHLAHALVAPPRIIRPRLHLASTTTETKGDSVTETLARAVQIGAIGGTNRGAALSAKPQRASSTRWPVVCAWTRAGGPGDWSFWQVSGAPQLSKAAVSGGSVVRQAVPTGQSARRDTDSREPSSQKR